MSPTRVDFSKPFLEGMAELRASCQLPPIGQYAGKVSCLKCTRSFHSSDRRSNRICSECKCGIDFQGTQDADSILPAIPFNVAEQMSTRRRGKKSFGGELPKQTIRRLVKQRKHS